MPKKLGNILVEAEIISQKTLDRALEIQRGSGKKLGQVLEEMGVLTAAELAEALAVEHGELKELLTDQNTLYRRFRARHIIMHLLVITSFLGLSLTGLPLKFSDQEWARFLMSLYGGTLNAGTAHRIFAVVLSAVFLTAIAMSIHFVFFRKGDSRTWLQRLFGPDSLLPNLRDLEDLVGMVRWFFFRGPKPQFDRWTYWEKFDFLAVFWGMFAIGGSGLMLWFPEVFGTFLPGWVFNVATIIHSDEALLATGFIFSVHFFNTHGRPEKFPMDFVIFNGQMTRREFMEERGDQWRRYQDSGTTEEHRVAEGSSALYDFLFKGFGFLAVFIGIVLLILMIYAFIEGAG